MLLSVSSLLPELQWNLHDLRDKMVPVLSTVVLGIPERGGAVEQRNE